MPAIDFYKFMRNVSVRSILLFMEQQLAFDIHMEFDL